MLRVINVLVWILLSVQVSAQFEFSGIVYDENEDPLTGANVVIDNSFLGAVTGSNGEFKFRDLDEGEYRIRISFIGYRPVQETIRINSDLSKEYRLERKAIMGDEVIVTAVRANERDPVAFSSISSEEIEKQDLGQDIPYLLSLTPSLVSTSDAGNGIGYTGIRIRGTDANRINVTVNGIPLNDAETHGVWWVNMPDFASSVENIQIQRGVGTSTNGAAAFGASINFQTFRLKNEPHAEINTGYGSFNSMRNSISVGSGLINDRFTFDMRLSEINSDGFIDRASTNLQSYYLSGAWYTPESILKFTTFSGKEKTYQAWDGVPEEILEEDRQYNGIGRYVTEDGDVKYYDNETDNYDQTHYQLHYSRELTGWLNMNSALHYTRGIGYYEQYKEDSDFADYGLNAISIGTDTTISQTDLIRRKWLDNHFYGAVFSLHASGRNFNSTFGAGWNHYDGDHYGTLIWARFAAESEINDRWYENKGVKTDFHSFLKMNYYFIPEINLYGDIQVRKIDYAIDGIDDDSRNITQEHRYFFVNPKLGINYSPNTRNRAYFSFSIANREPTRGNFIDADPNQPVPRPEKLFDYEMGYQFVSDRFTGNMNLYFMDYTDQLVLTGEINDVGNPVMTNVKDSYRAGIELIAGYRFTDWLQWGGNVTFSRNKIRNMTAHIDNWDYWNNPDENPLQYEEEFNITDISFSPGIIAGSRLEISPFQNFDIEFQSKYVGKQYIDNTSSEARKLDPWFVNDLRLNYSFNTKWSKDLSLNVLIANIFNHKYESNAWTYRYFYEGEKSYMTAFYPQAGIHFMAGLRLSF